MDGERFSLLSLAHRVGEGGRGPGEGMSLTGLREDVLQTNFRQFDSFTGCVRNTSNAPRENNTAL